MSAEYLLYNRFMELTKRPEGASRAELMGIMAEFPQGGKSQSTFERILRELRQEYGLLLAYDSKDKVYRLDWNADAERLMHITYQMQMCKLTKGEQLNTAYIDFGILPSEHGISNFDGLAEAIQHKHWIRIAYKPFYTNEVNEYELRPLFLKLWNNRYYLVAKKRNETFFRNFGLERIQALEMLRERFELEEGESKEAYAHIIGISEAQLPAEHIVIETSLHGANFLSSLKLHSSQRKEAMADGQYRVHLQVVPNRELMEILAAMNQPVKVVAPDSLRKAFCERLLKHLAVNGGGE